ncbi:hypothetical protein ACIBG7_43290 [Nonomuraea sp. NPDC050328]|uniref:hypothetical protein n=1 Tax=Nonomuraea sp. NPDC050328 TaxID=3364361 RepID=UPI0037BC107B
MPIKDWADGERPPASDLNRYPLQQVHVIKAADESIASSTTMQNDDHLFVEVEAGTDYWLQAYLIYEGAGEPGGDFKVGWLAPSGTTLDWMSDSFASTATATSGAVSRTYQTLTSLPAPGTQGAGVGLVCMPRGVLRIGGTAGTLRLRWAQNISSATPTILRAGSMLRLRRLTT